MADRYWVGGAGTWDATTTTNWSATSGGAGGASAPTSADNVIFNTLSNATAYAVTVGTNANALDITIAGPAVGNVTITSGATAVINCYGSWTNAATGVVFTTTSGANINFLATTTGKTITTNNVTLGAMAVVLNGVGGEWSLGSAFTITANFTVTSGTFTTTASNYALNVLRLLSSSVNVRSILFNASAITVSGPTAVDFTTTTNLTFNAGTSTLIGTNSSSTLAGGAQTFYDVTFSSAAAGTTTIIGANTFNVLTQAAISTAGIRVVSLNADQTVATLTLSSGASAVTRTFVRSDTVGTQRTLTVATLTAISDVDFRDIVAAGASGTWSGTRLGDCKNNSNITFVAGVNKYWSTVAGVSASWSATAWATSSGGVPALNNFPLAQDTCIIDDSGATVGDGLRNGGVIQIDANWNMGTLNFSNRTVAFNWTQNNLDPTLYGDVTLTTAMTMLTVTGTPSWTFSNQGTVQALDSAGLTIRLSQLVINSPSGGVSLTTNTTVDLSPIIAPNTLGIVTLNAGTLTLNNNTLTTTAFTTSSTAAHTLAFGTGNITLTGTGTVYTGSTTTTVTGTPLVICTDSSATARTLQPATVTEANSISFRITAGTGTLSLGTAPAYRDLDFTDGTNPTGYAGALGTTPATIYGNFKASTGMSATATANALTFAATSGTKTIDTAGVTFDRPFIFNGIGGTWQLQAALTSGSTRACTLTNGTLNLNGYTLTTGLFSSNTSNTRALAFGTGKIVLTGTTGTVLSMSTATNFTYTGTSRIELTASGAGRTITPPSTGAVESNVQNIYVTTGSDTLTVSGSARFLTFDLTGFTGTLTYASTSRYFGDLVFSSGMTLGSIGSVGFTFSKTSGTQTITSAGKTIGNNITVDAPNATVSMQDALSVTGTLTMINGTLKLKSGTTSTVGAFATSGTNQKYLYATTSGTQATISDASGTNSVDYLTIQDSAATGGALFQAFTSNFNVDAGNNTGWKFSNNGGTFLVFF